MQPNTKALYGEAAGLEIVAHLHMLRHACGFALADKGADTRLIQDYLRPPEHSAHRPLYRHKPGAV
jgi:site-specific recombinase XerD